MQTSPFHAEKFLESVAARLLAALLGLAVLPALAEETPLIVVGDHLFVSARIVDCSLDPVLVDYAQVGEDGSISLLSGIALPAAGRSMEAVKGDLLDALEQRQGHRPRTLSLYRVDDADQKKVAMLLLRMVQESRTRCRQQPDLEQQDWQLHWKVAVHEPPAEQAEPSA